MRRFTPIELAIALSLAGTIAAIAVPTFARELHASRFSEPIDALQRMSTQTISYVEVHHELPASAPMTPEAPPRGAKQAYPAEIWEHPTWKALSFQPAPDGVPIAYAYAFDAHADGFVAHAHGDLDGDGVLSTFEMRGKAKPGEPLAIEPGLYVESELE
ncbi:MAG: hypothetical protein KIT84_23535 [Labilithrix sp.]|nr:hypothetical protein [Labilithrix sp.]MCW5814021.1 hypothetical protein [Labilithrix sp.]